MRKIDIEAERVFENRKAIGEPVRAKQSKYYWATEIPTRAHNDLTFGEIKGKNILFKVILMGASQEKNNLKY